jgi:hypothetical protein
MPNRKKPPPEVVPPPCRTSRRLRGESVDVMERTTKVSENPNEAESAEISAVPRSNASINSNKSSSEGHGSIKAPLGPEQQTETEEDRPPAAVAPPKRKRPGRPPKNRTASVQEPEEYLARTPYWPAPVAQNSKGGNDGGIAREEPKSVDSQTSKCQCSIYYKFVNLLLDFPQLLMGFIQVFRE